MNERTGQRRQTRQVAGGDARVGALLELAQYRLQRGFRYRLGSQPRGQLFGRHRMVQRMLDFESQRGLRRQQAAQVGG